MGRSGIFAAHLPPGTYRVYGRTPRLLVDSDKGIDREDKVPLGHPVTVTAGHITTIVLEADVP